MRPYVIVAGLAAASSLLAQAPAEQTPQPASAQPPQKQRALPRTSPQGQRVGQADPRVPTPPGVPPNRPVVTVKGVCQEKQDKSPCKTVVTREDLDRFIGASAPDAPAAVRGRAAIQYARTVAFSAMAEQQGLEKNPVLAKEMELQTKLLRMRILAIAFLQNLEAQSTTVLASETERYYQLHRDQYEEAKVRRVSIPMAVATAAGRMLDRETAKTEMEELRKRALGGEDDLNLLLRQSYERLQIQAEPQPASVVSVRRNKLQGDEGKVFDLNPGEITPVLELPASYAFYKLDSKDPVPIDSVRAEIEAALRRDAVQNQISKIGKRVTTDFDLQFLQLPSQPDVFGPAAINPLPPRPVRARANAQ